MCTLSDPGFLLSLSNAKPGTLPPTRCLALPQNPRPTPASVWRAPGPGLPASPRLPSRRARGDPAPLPSGWGLACGARMARRRAGFCVLAASGPARDPEVGWLQTAGHSQLPEAATCCGSWPQPPPSKPATSGPRLSREPSSGFLPIDGPGWPPHLRALLPWEGASTGSGGSATDIWGRQGESRRSTDRIARTKAQDKTNQGSHVISVSLSTRLREFSHLSP